MPKFDNLTEEERKEVLKILNQFSTEGESKAYNTLLYSDYEEIPVNVETFLRDRKYLGSGLINDEGTFTVYPYWVDTLKKIFPDPLKPAQYNTLALTGAIGLGKSFMAVLVMLYELYRMLCLKDPYVYYGLQPIDKITFATMNITLDASKGVAWDKMQQLLQTSPWFMSHGTVSGSVNVEWNPPKGIELIAGSLPRHIIGRAVFCAFLDEISFQPNQDVEKQKEKAKDLVSAASTRMQSRFMKGDKNPTILIVASSKRTEQSFMETFIQKRKEMDSKTTLIIDEPQWIIRNDKAADSYFKVAVGNKFLASEVIPFNATEKDLSIYRDRGFNLLDVPIGYYENFIEDIDKSLQEIAGISTTSSSRYISGPRLADVKHEEMKNPFQRDVIEVGNGPEDTAQYSDFFNMDYVDKSMMEKPLYVHLDMSISGDKTGIAGVWIKGIKVPEEGHPDNRDLVYKLAFSVSIKAPKGYQVSFEKNRQFIYWLRENGFNVKGVSCFPANTKVATPNGPKRIDSLSVGDIIYSYDKNKVVENSLKNVIYQGISEEFVNIELFDGYTIKCTPEHPILTTEGYVEARYITDQTEIIVDDKLYYRYMLLNTGVFFDNEYFNKYIELICTPTFDEYTEQHHILPHFISKTLGICNEETVTLNYTNHFLAHYYLLHCISDIKLKQKAAYACKMMYDGNKLPKDESCIDTYLLECIKDAKIQYSKYHSDNMKLKMIGNTNRLGLHNSAESKKKSSKSNKETYWAKSDEERKSQSDKIKTKFTKGNIPWNTGIGWKELYTKEDRKKKFGSNTGKHWYTNGVENILLYDTEIIPEDFKRGRTISPETKQKISKSVKSRFTEDMRSNISNHINGTHWYNNGSKEIHIKGDCPDGFVKGRLPISDEVKHKMSLSASNREGGAK